MRTTESGTCEREVHDINDAADVIGAWIRAGSDLPIWETTARGMANSLMRDARREPGETKRAYDLTVTVPVSGVVTIVKHVCRGYACEGS